jgi:hypothetical protein
MNLLRDLARHLRKSQFTMAGRCLGAGAEAAEPRVPALPDCPDMEAPILERKKEKRRRPPHSSAFRLAFARLAGFSLKRHEREAILS